MVKWEWFTGLLLLISWDFDMLNALLVFMGLLVGYNTIFIRKAAFTQLGLINVIDSDFMGIIKLLIYPKSWKPGKYEVY